MFFEFDQATLVPEAENLLRELADELNELGPPITIGGHTGSEGPDDYNQDLSERRADAVRVFLESELGDGYMFEVNGYSRPNPSHPIRTTTAPTTPMDEPKTAESKSPTRQPKALLEPTTRPGPSTGPSQDHDGFVFEGVNQPILAWPGQRFTTTVRMC